MQNNEQALNKSLSQALAEGMAENHELAEVRPGVSNIAKVTNPDTGRSSRSMEEQMQKIIAGLDREIADAEQVRDVVDRRINDLSKARAVAKTAYAMLLTR
jgi:hypothetical protein